MSIKDPGSSAINLRVSPGTKVFKAFFVQITGIGHNYPSALRIFPVGESSRFLSKVFSFWDPLNLLFSINLREIYSRKLSKIVILNLGDELMLKIKNVSTNYFIILNRY